MGILSLCADSARPPGTTTLLEDTDGSCITIGYKFCNKRQCYMAPNLYEVFHSDVTTYYSTQAANPSSPLHLSTQSSLHVISALTCDIFTLAQQQMCTPLPIFNWFNKQWLPPSPMKGNNNGTPPMYDMNLLLCFILLTTFFTSRSKTKRTRERTHTT